MVPNVTEQTRIADILSAYDDLIENNRRRMELLEDAARQLYQEWFVRLRFPGREHTRIINGVPEGWERKTIGELAPLNYGKALKEDDRVGGTISVYGSSGVVGTHDQPLVNGSGIIVGRKGNVGSVFWTERPFWAIDTVYFVSSEQSSWYLFHCLRHVPFQSSDVAVPGLNRTYAHSLKILFPKQIIRDQFEENVAPMFEQMARLRAMNEKLRTARDLLLPRLMSGEIAV
jgi:type I restriction enzyme, S subunit